MGWSIENSEGSQVIISNIAFVLANSVDPDEMLYYAAFQFVKVCIDRNHLMRVWMGYND